MGCLSQEHEADWSLHFPPTPANDATEVCNLDGRCACPTCGVAQAMLRGELVGTGCYSREDAARVTVEASLLGCASYPYLASVRVDGREVYRIMFAPDEALMPDVVADVRKALER